MSKVKTDDDVYTTLVYRKGMSHSSCKSMLQRHFIKSHWSSHLQTSFWVDDTYGQALHEFWDCEATRLNDTQIYISNGTKLNFNLGMLCWAGDKEKGKEYMEEV